MSNKTNKKKVVGICIQMQEELVANYENQVATKKADLTNKAHSASQSEDRVAGDAELLRVYEEQLSFSSTDLGYLNSLNFEDEYESVQPGALVICKDILFLVGISTDKFQLDGKTIVGISERAPIYKNMDGLAKGDSFKFHDAEYLIDEIY